MRFMFSLVLVTGLAVVSQASPEKPQPAKPAVPVLKADAVDRFAFNQLTSGTPLVAFEVPRPVSSLVDGLPHVQKFSEHPILAMAEAEGWFFYAVSAVRGQKTGVPVHFLSGYAIKRNSRQVMGFSVW